MSDQSITFVITLHNAGGTIDARTITVPAGTDEQYAKAAQAAIEMIQAAGELYDGDHITVRRTE